MALDEPSLKTKKILRIRSIKRLERLENQYVSITNNSVQFCGAPPLLFC